MPLEAIGTIEIPGSADSLFDHGAFEPTTRRVFVAHTWRNCVQVLDERARRHAATLDGFPEPAGVVVEDGEVLVTNRGAASVAWLTAELQPYVAGRFRRCGGAHESPAGRCAPDVSGDVAEGPGLRHSFLENGHVGG